MKHNCNAVEKPQLTCVIKNAKYLMHSEVATCVKCVRMCDVSSVPVSVRRKLTFIELCVAFRMK